MRDLPSQHIIEALRRLGYEEGNHSADFVTFGVFPRFILVQRDTFVTVDVQLKWLARLGCPVDQFLAALPDPIVC